MNPWERPIEAIRADIRACLRWIKAERWALLAMRFEQDTPTQQRAAAYHRHSQDIAERRLAEFDVEMGRRLIEVRRAKNIH